MFIAVRPINDAPEDKILIFDTKDLILDYVDKCDLELSITRRCSGMYIGNEILTGLNDDLSYKYQKHCLFYSITERYVTFTEGRNSKGYSRLDKVYIRTSLKWYFGDTELILQLKRFKPLGYSFYVNDKYISHIFSDTFDIRLHYVFFCNHMLVARFTFEDNYDCLTVVVSETGEPLSIWDNKYFWYGDKSIKSRIEVTMPY